MQLPKGAFSPQVDIIIVNWNSGQWLANCLGSIAAFGGECVGRVVVVDNGSTDGSADGEFAQLPLTVIRTHENLGFGRACNVGANETASPYILFLNPDAAIEEGTLQTVLSFMASPAAADVGVCGVRLVGQDGQTQRRTCSLPTPKTIFSSAMCQLDFDHMTSRDVDQIIGAFYLIRRSIFEALGGFDERFFVYMEEVDLSKRVLDCGWRVHYLSTCSAFHYEGGSSEKVKASRLFYSKNSRIFYSLKHFPKVSAFAAIATILLIEPFVRLGRAVLRGSGSEMWDTLRGYGMLWRRLPQTLIAAARFGRQPVCASSEQPLQAAPGPRR